MPQITIVIYDTDSRYPAVMAALMGTAAAPVQTDAPAPKAEPKAGKSTAVSAKTETAPKEEAQAASSETAAPPSEPSADKVALLKSLAMKFAQANGREALVGLFAEYGATNPSTVPADQLDAVLARLQE